MKVPKLRTLIFKEAMDYHQTKIPTLKFSAVLKPAPKQTSSTITSPIEESSTIIGTVPANSQIPSAGPSVEFKVNLNVNHP